MNTQEFKFENSLNVLRSLTDADFVALALAEEGERSVRWCCASGSRNDRYKRIVLRSGKGVAGTVMRSGRPMILSAFQMQRGDDPTDYPIMLAENLHAIVAYPITIQDHVTGVLLVGNRYERQFPAETVEMIGTVAEQFGSMMQSHAEQQAKAGHSHCSATRTDCTANGLLNHKTFISR